MWTPTKKQYQTYKHTMMDTQAQIYMNIHSTATHTRTGRNHSNNNPSCHNFHAINSSLTNIISDTLITTQHFTNSFITTVTDIVQNVIPPFSFLFSSIKLLFKYSPPPLCLPPPLPPLLSRLFGANGKTD